MWSMIKIYLSGLIAGLVFALGMSSSSAASTTAQPGNYSSTLVRINSWVVRTDQATFKTLTSTLMNIKTTPPTAESPGYFTGLLTESQLEKFLQTVGDTKKSQVIADTSPYDFDDENKPAKYTGGIIYFPKIVLYNNQDSWLAMKSSLAYVSDCQKTTTGQLSLSVSTLNPGFKLDVKPTVSADQKYVLAKLGITFLILENIKTVKLHLNTTANGGFIQIPALLNHDISTTTQIPVNSILAIGSTEGVNSTIIRGKTSYTGATPDFTLVFIQASVLTPDEANKYIQDWEIQREIHQNMLRDNGDKN
jgi:hypothetical protein